MEPASVMPEAQATLGIRTDDASAVVERTLRADIEMAEAPADTLALSLPDENAQAESLAFAGTPLSDEELLSPATAPVLGIAVPAAEPASLFDAVPVMFDFDSTAISTFFEESLQPLVDFLTATPTATVTLTGHTDNVGSEEYNQMLSVRRAQAIREFLLQQGIDRKMIRIQGAGEKRPEKSNATPSGRKANRRVSIAVT